MGQFGMHRWGNQYLLLEIGKNVRYYYEDQIVQGSRVSYDRRHLQAKLPVRLPIPPKVFERIFEFDAMLL